VTSEDLYPTSLDVSQKDLYVGSVGNGGVKVTEAIDSGSFGNGNIEGDEIEFRLISAVNQDAKTGAESGVVRVLGGDELYVVGGKAEETDQLLTGYKDAVLLEDSKNADDRVGVLAQGDGTDSGIGGGGYGSPDTIAKAKGNLEGGIISEHDTGDDFGGGGSGDSVIVDDVNTSLTGSFIGDVVNLEGADSLIEGGA